MASALQSLTRQTLRATLAVLLFAASGAFAQYPPSPSAW